MGTQPPKAWIARYLKAAALNSVAARRNAPIPVQQRFYTQWMKLRDEGMRKWPHVDFDAGLTSAIERWLEQHPMTGPGKDW